MKTALKILTASIALALPAMAATPTDAPSEAVNANKSIWTQNVTQFRKEHSVAGGYTKKWDLSDLPHYQPRQQIKGKLRVLIM